MSKVSLELDTKELKRLIERMSIEDKIKLIKELERETWAKRITKVLKNIDARRKKYKISNREISQEIEKARREFYARRN